jgi:hypothetical protein
MNIMKKQVHFRIAFMIMLIVTAMAANAQGPYPNTGPHTVCLNSNEPYGVINTAGSTYAWSIIPGTGGNGTISGTGNLITVLWTSAGTCTLQVIETTVDGCILAPVTVSIIVNPLPDVFATPPSQAICSQATTNIVLTSSSPTTTFAWTAALTSGTATGFSDGTGALIAQTLINNTNAPATVTYTVTPTDLGCTGVPITVVVTVFPELIATATPPAESICSGATTNIALTSNVANTTFTWTAALTSGTVTGFSNGSGATIAQTLSNTTTTVGTVTYTITPADPNCTGATITVVITVYPEVVVTATPASQAICSGATTNIALTANTPNPAFTWTAVLTSGTATGFADGTGPLIAQTLINTTTTPATVTYTITATENGCPSTPVIVVVTVNPLPIPTITGPTPICQNVPGVYITEAGMTNYVWTLASGGNISAGQGTNSITVDWTQSGTFNITVIYTDPNGCSPTTPTVYPVVVNPSVPTSPIYHN